MAQKRLEDFSRPAIVEEPVQNEDSQSIRQASQSRSLTEIIDEEKQRIKTGFEAPQNLPPSYFVSATYEGDRRTACIKLYEPTTERIYFWYDNTGHQPYLLTNLSPIELEKISQLTSHPGFDHLELAEKVDPLTDKQVTVTKVVAKDPLAIGGRPSGCMRDIIPQEFAAIAKVEPTSVKIWEAHIKYYESYIYDRELEPGMLYAVEKGNMVPSLSEPSEEMVRKTLQLFKTESEEECNNVVHWSRLLEYPAPKFRRIAMDIEVLAPVPTRVPDPRIAECPVICVSFYGSDGSKRVLLLQREGAREGSARLPADVSQEFSIVKRS